MAKTIGVLNSAALPLTETRAETLPSISAIARRAASFFRRWQDRDIERFIQERGGVMTDVIEREIGRKFGLRS
jgi:hypothetical protein